LSRGAIIRRAVEFAMLLTSPLSSLYSLSHMQEAAISPAPTPYADVNALLALLLSETQTALGDQFLGMYLYGSLASSDFDPHSSDVDFVVVTKNEIADEMIPKLQALHERIATSGVKWATKLEGSYIARAALRRYDPNDVPRPQYNKGEFLVAPHNSDWVIQRHILREHGVVVAGSPIQPFIDPITANELRGAVAGILLSWWTHILAEPSPLLEEGFQPYAVLTMCRAWYCFEHGAIVSKPFAARWASQALDARWTRLIEHALAQQTDISPQALEETQALIRCTLTGARNWESEQTP